MLSKFKLEMEKHLMQLNVVTVNGYFAHNFTWWKAQEIQAERCAGCSTTEL